MPGESTPAYVRSPLPHIGKGLPYTLGLHACSPLGKVRRAPLLYEAIVGGIGSGATRTRAALEIGAIMAEQQNIPDTNTHEGLGAVSADQVKQMEQIVSDTDHPYTDPITGKPNEDIPENEVGVSDASKEAKQDAAQREELAIDRPEETDNENQWEDPYLEDR